jgi:hypothetical protein
MLDKTLALIAVLLLVALSRYLSSCHSVYRQISDRPVIDEPPLINSALQLIITAFDVIIAVAIVFVLSRGGLLPR